MAHNTLVTDDIRSAEPFLRELAKVVPVKAAFWLNVVGNDDPYPYLFVALDGSDHADDWGGYRAVVNTTRSLPAPAFDPFRVKVIDVKTAIAQYAIELNKLFPPHPGAPTKGFSYVGTRFGDLNVDYSYVYPPSVWQPEAAQVTT